MLGIDRPEQVARDPIVGSIFENLVIIEALKARSNKGLAPNLYFFRDSNGNEIDLIFEQNRKLIAIEIKSASTFSSKQLMGLKKFAALTSEFAIGYLIYNGDEKKLSDGLSALNYKDTANIFV